MTQHRRSPIGGKSKRSCRLAVALIVPFLLIAARPGATRAPELRPGLVGHYFNNQDLTDPDQSLDVLKGVAQKWDKGRGNDWSGRWSGLIEGPATGAVEFEGEVIDGLRLVIDGDVVIDNFDGSGSSRGVASMKKGERVPVEVSFVSRRGQARLFLFWRWEGQPRTIVPSGALSHEASAVPEGATLFDYDARWSETDDPPPGASEAEMPAFVGGTPPYADADLHDGGFRPAVGVHNFQVIRANRTHPELVTRDLPHYPDAGLERTGFTYNHAPMLSYWKDRFWLLYRSGPVHEHQQPCYALITWSKNGRTWEKPRTLFPARKFRNRKQDDAVQYSISHQRMGWYLSPGGRLLASGFYGMPGTPNDGKGVGRVVREVYGPDDYGPIYWVRYNPFQGFGPDDSPHYPHYTKSPDPGFVETVDGLLANKLMVQQWYEEDRDTSEGFFAYAGGNARYLKAFNWYTRPDGKIVAMWKWKKMAVANAWKPDEISVQGVGADIFYGGAKIWGQRTSDGRYVLAYNPVLNTTWRHPLSLTTGADGMSFDTYFLNVHGEAPLMRFGGANKDGGGAQYVRGIVPGNGTPPDGALWLTYSSNKEDLFVTRVPVPVRGTVTEDVDDDFEGREPGGLIAEWNIYTGLWNPIEIVKEAGNQVLRLADQDPWDYAKAVRVFPETSHARVSLDLRVAEVGHDNLEIEIQNHRGQRPVRIVLVGKDRVIVANDGPTLDDVAALVAGEWVHLDIDVNAVAGEYDLHVDGEVVVDGAAFAKALDHGAHPYDSSVEGPTVERVVFRTGIHRMRDFSRYGFQANSYKMYEPDLPGPDEPVSRTVVDLDNVKTSTTRP